MTTCDFLVIGGGIGLSIARELRRRQPNAYIILIEKNPPAARMPAGAIASSPRRVLLFPDSLKAKFTRLGKSTDRHCEESGSHSIKSGSSLWPKMQAI
jgi:L-2-hydroxyglutarate oxidase